MQYLLNINDLFRINKIPTQDTTAKLQSEIAEKVLRKSSDLCRNAISTDLPFIQY